MTKIVKLIMKSVWLREALSEIDQSCDTLTIICNPPGGGKKQSPLRIHAVGAFGSTEMDYPNDREVLELFECVERVSFNSPASSELPEGFTKNRRGRVIEFAIHDASQPRCIDRVQGM
ncbi:Rad1 domain-containing protein [Rhizoctonia solani AG-1 IA]|uniref:Rad1 domain-containing protein n=1 Tax=Thanatephorus cucumeris (strain AG1-IA) TaxID=983506 RepID=L8X1A6_THACA|nr:Rad1 domain-containing protein [Rhizoctonia solani AG-1 IA]